MTPEELKMISDRLGYVQAIRRLETDRAFSTALRAVPPVPAGSNFCGACGQDTKSAQDIAALIAEVDRLRALVTKYESLIERIERTCDRLAPYLAPYLAMRVIEDEIEAFTADINKGATE